MLTLTTRTATLGIRLNTEDKERLSEYITRESLVSILRQIDSGKIRITDKGVEFIGIETTSEGVNTTIEPISENEDLKNAEISGVNTCEGCPYMEAVEELNTSGYLEACHTQGVDAQKALDKYTQSIWRQG